MAMVVVSSHTRKKRSYPLMLMLAKRLYKMVAASCGPPKLQTLHPQATP